LLGCEHLRRRFHKPAKSDLAKECRAALKRAPSPRGQTPRFQSSRPCSKHSPAVREHEPAARWQPMGNRHRSRSPCSAGRGIAAPSASESGARPVASLDQASEYAAPDTQPRRRQARYRRAGRPKQSHTRRAINAGSLPPKTLHHCCFRVNASTLSRAHTGRGPVVRASRRTRLGSPARAVCRSGRSCRSPCRPCRRSR
jgi:hypothetical protein